MSIVDIKQGDEARNEKSQQDAGLNEVKKLTNYYFLYSSCDVLIL